MVASNIGPNPISLPGDLYKPMHYITHASLHYDRKTTTGQIML